MNDSQPDGHCEATTCASSGFLSETIAEPHNRYLKERNNQNDN
jgi:hypothetical protein